KAALIDYGAIRLGDKELLSSRCRRTYEELVSIIEKYSPDHVAVESLFFGRNASSAIKLAQARAVALLAASEKGVPIYEYAPKRVKQAMVGYGQATKSQVQEMVKNILNLEKVPRPQDASDALAVAICHGAQCERVGWRGREV
ncbi:MAG: crossover junction endodeoxyribonuclease RuvC, partial [Thermoplasmata archaeon]|nr:crossover junction endodeoxyribonuclease RuvC [Thermoplasmata archaeon]